MAREIKSPIRDRQAIHMNGHTVCAVAIETTGPQAGYNDLIQITVLPVDSFFDMSEIVIPFHMDIRPGRPQHIQYDKMRFKQRRLCELAISAVDSFEAVDRFESWFQLLHLPEKKQIVPLAHDWERTRDFLIDWFGFNNFSFYFNNAMARDVMRVAHYLNDRADQQAEPFPFPKVSISYLCKLLKLEYLSSDDTMLDALHIAQIYKKLMRREYV